MAKRLPPSITHTKAAELRRVDLRNKVSYSSREFWFGPVRRAMDAGVEHFKPHDLQRTFATASHACCAASKILGHTAMPSVPIRSRALGVLGLGRRFSTRRNPWAAHPPEGESAFTAAQAG